MVFNPLEWPDTYYIDINKDKVDYGVDNFPLSIILVSGTGENNFNTNKIFDDFTYDPNLIDGTVLLLRGCGDESDYRQNLVYSGGTKLCNDSLNYKTITTYKFDGVDDYVSIDDNQDWVLGVSDFTIDLWVKFSNVSDANPLIGQTVDDNNRWYLYANSNNNKLSFYIASGGTTLANYECDWLHSIDTWYHIALVRYDIINIKIFINGILQSPSVLTDIGSNFIPDFNTPLVLGKGRYGGNWKYLKGSLTHIRLSKEVLWLSNFVTTNITYLKNKNTRLLTNIINSNILTELTTYNVSSVSEDVFGKNSFYFSGGPYMYAPYSSNWEFSTGDFCISMWVRIHTLGYQYALSINPSGQSYNSIALHTNSSSQLQFDFASTSGGHTLSFTDSEPLSLNKWYHLVFSRNGNNFKAFKNGKLFGSGTSSNSVKSGSSLVIGGANDNGGIGNAPWYGNISEIQIIKGYHVYDIDFILPKRPLGNSWYNRNNFIVYDNNYNELYTETSYWEDGFVSVYPKVYDANTVKATSYFDSRYYPWFGANPNIATTGSITNQSWLASNGNHTNQKWNIDLGREIIVKRLYLENLHHDGSSYYDNGMKDFSVYGTNSFSAFNNTTYGDITDLTLLGSFTCRRHKLLNREDPQYFYLDNDSAFRYYILRIDNDFGGPSEAVGFRQIEFQEYVKKASLWTKVPNVHPDKDTKLYLCYNLTTTSGYTGDTKSIPAQNVWGLDYKAVYHMDQKPTGGSGCIFDSTNNYNCTPQGTMTDAGLLESSLSKSLYFDGVDDYLINNSLVLPSNYIITSTLNVYSFGSGFAIVNQGDNAVSNQQGFWFAVNSSGYLYISYYNGSWRTVTSNLNLNLGLNTVSVAVNNTALYCIFSVNGQQQQMVLPASIPSSTYPFKIGAGKGASMQSFFNGSIDDVSILNDFNNDYWLKLYNYNSTNNLCIIKDELVFDPQLYNKSYKLTINKDNIEEDLVDFPVSIVLSSGTGRNFHDVSGIFDDYTVSGTDSYTQLFLPFYGDFSKSNNTLVFNGNPSIQSSGKFGDCVYFDGSGDYISVSDHIEFELGAYNFTIDGWVYLKTTKTNMLIAKRTSDSLYGPFIMYVSSQNYVIFRATSDGGATPHINLVSSTTISLNTWHHIAVTRSGDYWRLFIDGVTVAFITSSISIYNNSISYLIGGESSVSSNSLHGYIEEFRISKNIARWVADFEVPAERYIVDDYTKLLLRVSGDVSNNNHTVVFNNQPQLLSTNTNFNTAVYFNGSSYLTIADHDSLELESNNFTIDFRMKTSSTSYSVIFSKDTNTNVNYGNIACEINTVANKLSIFFNPNSGDLTGRVILTSKTSVNDSKWYHITISRYGNVWYLFINGILEDKKYSTTSIRLSTAPLYIGCSLSSSSPAFYYTGYLTEFRLVKGVSKYVSNFISPRYSYLGSAPNRKALAITTTISGIEKQLYSEIDVWRQKDKQAYLWTKVPFIDSLINTELTLYYGNQIENDRYVGDTEDIQGKLVWDDNFIGVYHLSQNLDNGKILNSSVGGLDGVPNGSMTSQYNTIGEQGNSINLNGTSQYINCGNPITIYSGGITLEGLVKPEDTTVDAFLTVGTSDYQAIELSTGATTNVVYSSNSSSWTTLANFPTNAGSYNYSALSINNTGYNYTLNNSFYSGNDNIPVLNNNNIKIGGHYALNSSYYYKGDIDEIRVSKVARSNAWLRATYYSNFNNLVTFSDILPIHYYFNGTVLDYSGSPLDGALVRAYNRANGSLVLPDTYTTSSGTFSIEVPQDDLYYIIALHPSISGTTNALIYDYVTPSGISI